MAPSKTPVVLPPSAPDDTEVEFTTLETKLETKFPPSFIKMLKRLSYEVAEVGMSEQEACVLVGYDYEKLIVLKAKEPLVKRLFEMKQLEYKRAMMKTLSAKARAGDDKLAQWLLEAKHPDEFNRRKGAGGEGGGGGEDLLGTAIEFVRKTTLPSGLVKMEAGKSFVTKKGNAPLEDQPNIRPLLAGRAAEIVAAMDKEAGNI